MLGYAWLGITIVVRAFALMLGYAWLGITIVVRAFALMLGYAWLGITIVVRAFALMLGYAWLGITIVVRAFALMLGYAWLGITIVVRAFALMLGYAWLGITIVVRAFALMLGYAWLGITIVRVARHHHRCSGFRADAGIRVARHHHRRSGFRADAGIRVARHHHRRSGFRADAGIRVARHHHRRSGFRADAGIRVARHHHRRSGFRADAGIRVARHHHRRSGFRADAGIRVARHHHRRSGFRADAGIRASPSSFGLSRWLGITGVLSYVWRGGSIVVNAVGLVRRVVARMLRAGAGYAWPAITIVVGAFAQMLGYAWVGITGVLSYVWRGVSFVARALRYAWTVVLMAQGYSWRVITTQLRPIWPGALAIRRFLVLGVSTGGLVVAWALVQLWWGLLMAIYGLSAGLIFAAGGVRMAITVVPDVARTGVWLAIHRKGVSTMPDNQVKREGLVSLVVTVLVLFVVTAVAVRIFWPAPPEPTVMVVHWTTGHLTWDGLLKDMAEEFNKAGHRIGFGTRIVVEVYDAPSELQGKYLIELLTNGKRLDLNKITGGYVVKDIPDPTIVTPSSAHWLVTVNYEVGRAVVDLDTAKSIVRPVIGIVTYEEMARCLGWPEKQIGFADIIALKNDPLGWRSYPDCASGEWGQRPLLAFTDPTTSSTGRSLHLSLYSIAANKRPQDLNIEDVNDPEVEAYVKGFQRLIDHYLIGTTVLNTKIHRGTRYGHFFIMPEDNLIHLYEGTEKSFMNGIKTTAPPIEERMVMIYPKEGSMPRNNCACIVRADWVNAEQVEAAQKWIEFIREDHQQRTFMAAGFRPGTDLDLNYPGSKISSEFGLDPEEPKIVLNPSLTRPDVAAAIDSKWEQVKKPGIVTFVVDTSGSMMGAKLRQARDGLNRALETMAKNNQVGFLSFDDSIHKVIPVGPLENNKWDVQDAVHQMRARGETALYEAIKTGIEMTAAAPGEKDSIRAVVVLTDGLANICQTRLDHIIEIESRYEAPISSISGCQEGSLAKDKNGSYVNTEDLIGTGLTIEARNPVQVFFIGIGEADLNIGRLLAEATGAEYQGVTEEDLANVLEEFSKYF